MSRRCSPPPPLVAQDVRTLRNIVPQTYRTVEADRTALAELLERAPLEFSGTAGAEILLPMPDGTFARFEVQESPIVEPALAKNFREIKTYVAQGIDDPTATARLDLTPAGFHAIILSPQHGVTFIDPYWRDSDTGLRLVPEERLHRRQAIQVPRRHTCRSGRETSRRRPARPPHRRAAPPLSSSRSPAPGEYAVAVSHPNPCHRPACTRRRSSPPRTASAPSTSATLPFAWSSSRTTTASST
jgi:hypothetical protein